MFCKLSSLSYWYVQCRREVERMEDMAPYCASDYYLKIRPEAKLRKGTSGVSTNGGHRNI